MMDMLPGLTEAPLGVAGDRMISICCICALALGRLGSGRRVLLHMQIR